MGANKRYPMANWFFPTATLAMAAQLWLGCAPTSLATPSHGMPVVFHDLPSGLAFRLPASWRGYTVLTRDWEGWTYVAESDRSFVSERGRAIVLRHPRRTRTECWQDIPILVLTRVQWDSYHRGAFAIGAGGVQLEFSHNSNYVFTISTRFNADDSVWGWKEASDAIGGNMAVQGPPLFPQ